MSLMVNQQLLEPSPVSIQLDSEKKESETLLSDLVMQIPKSSNAPNVLNQNATNHSQVKKKIRQNVQIKDALKHCKS
jgi:hypothetical protein